MNLNDEELQRRIEGNEATPEGSTDAAAYKIVFAGLAKEPKTSFSARFADRVLATLQVRQRKEARRDFFWLMFGVIFLLVGLVLTAVLAGLTLELGFLKEIAGFAGVFVFAALMIVAFTWVEKKALWKRA